MGRIDAIIPENLESKVRIEVVKRFGGKKGDLQKAVVEALEMWVNSDVIKELEETATSKNCAGLTRDKAIGTLRKMGRIAMPSLARISHHPDATDQLKDHVIDAIDKIIENQN